MKNKTVNLVLILWVIGIFLSYFTIRQQIFDNHSFVEKIDTLERYAKENDWEEAKEIAQNLKTDWSKIKPWVAFNYAEEDFSTFEHALYSIIGGVEVEDMALILPNTMIAKDLWINFQRLVPEP
ncbi:DUF4363 family protein [Clostridiaceae bacterium 35-E11]